MSAYYNEIDPFKAEVLREAIKAGAIAPGDVDERSIADVQPAELVGYSQWHFFAGGGFWSLALRNAGWPDSRPVATLSCPCPSFSAAGKGKGFDDPRHLWPEAYRLIRECRFPILIGEQVSAAIGHGWLDLVCGDLEAEGYAVAASVLGAHSAGAPHVRQRLYFCAVTEGERSRARLRDSHSGGERWDLADDNLRTEQRSDAGCTPGYAKHIDESGQGLRRQQAKIDDAGAGTCRESVGGSHARYGDEPDRRQVGGAPGAAGGEIREQRLRAESGAGSVPGERADSDGRQPGDGDLQRSREQRLLAADRGTGDDAHAARDGWDEGRPESGRQQGRSHATEHGCFGRSPDAASPRCDGEIRRSEGDSRDEARLRMSGADGHPGSGDDSLGPRLEGHFGDVREWRGPGWLDPLTARSVAEAGATRGYWADCDWWYGRDEKYRPAGPGIFPLAHGSPARVGRLRMYGDAIVVPAAQAFIESVIEAVSASESLEVR